MPSTLIHLAIGALLATALLEDHFNLRTLTIVLAVSAVSDLDTFLDLLIPGTHRAAGHTLVIPVIAITVIAYDLQRDQSWLRERGPGTVRLAWVSVLAFVFAGIGPDLFFNGANLLYPFHDQFYALDGKILYSNQRGLVQTLWETETSTRGTTGTQHFRTGVNPNRGAEPENVERIFPIANGGLQVLLILVSTVITSIRLWTTRS